MNLVSAKKIKSEISDYIKNNPAEIDNDGFIHYKPLSNIDKENYYVISFMGRTSTPSTDIDAGSHMVAAYGAMSGFRAYVSSAHDDNRNIALCVLFEAFTNNPNIKVYIYGHSHGGDHASRLAAEYKNYTGAKVNGLITIDPVNSPTPFSLTSVEDEYSMILHLNYYQSNALWYGGSINTADLDIDVSNNNSKYFKSWSAIINNNDIDDNFSINHKTIDEDLLLGGYLYWPWSGNHDCIFQNVRAKIFGN